MLIAVKITRKENAAFFEKNVGDIVNVEFETYVAAVVASEIGNAHLEACKAQAVAARSFAVSRGVLRGRTISDSSSDAQAYRAIRYDKEKYPNAIKGTEATSGDILVYNGEVISAVYTASNGGRTVSSESKWGGVRPYLIEQDDPWDAAAGYPLKGHGVGMSQRGAIYAAENKTGYKKILSFYYPGTKIGDISDEEKAEEVVRIAKEQLGFPYVFGALGENCTPENRDRRTNSSYPTIRSKCQALNGKAKNCDGCAWKGGRIFDCRGFTYWVLKQVGITISTVGATTQYNTKGDWAMQGEISEMPDVVCCVFKKKDSKMSHTGLHIGGGVIIHCSTDVHYGKTTDSGWTHFAVPNGLYSEEYLADKKKMTVLARGSKGVSVKNLQEMLNNAGCDSGEVDGSFGPITEAALKAFQKKNGLKETGIADEKTMSVLLDVTQGVIPATMGESIEDDAPVAENEPVKEDTVCIELPRASAEELFALLERSLRRG